MATLRDLARMREADAPLDLDPEADGFGDDARTGEALKQGHCGFALRKPATCTRSGHASSPMGENAKRHNRHMSAVCGFPGLAPQTGRKPMGTRRWR